MNENLQEMLACLAKSLEFKKYFSSPDMRALIEIFTEREDPKPRTNLTNLN